MTYTVKIVDCTTGEEIEREATADEITQFELDKKNNIAIKKQSDANALAKQAILDRLGLTADEVALLLQ